MKLSEEIQQGRAGMDPDLCLSKKNKIGADALTDKIDFVKSCIKRHSTEVLEKIREPRCHSLKKKKLSKWKKRKKKENEIIIKAEKNVMILS